MDAISVKNDGTIIPTSIQHYHAERICYGLANPLNLAKNKLYNTIRSLEIEDYTSDSPARGSFSVSEMQRAREYSRTSADQGQAKIPSSRSRWRSPHITTEEENRAGGKAAGAASTGYRRTTTSSWRRGSDDQIPVTPRSKRRPLPHASRRRPSRVQGHGPPRLTLSVAAASPWKPRAESCSPAGRGAGAVAPTTRCPAARSRSGPAARVLGLRCSPRPALVQRRRRRREVLGQVARRLRLRLRCPSARWRGRAGS